MTLMTIKSVKKKPRHIVEITVSVPSDFHKWIDDIDAQEVLRMFQDAVQLVEGD